MIIPLYKSAGCIYNKLYLRWINWANQSSKYEKETLTIIPIKGSNKMSESENIIKKLYELFCYKQYPLVTLCFSQEKNKILLHASHM